MEKSKPEQTKPLQNHQQKYERIHSQSTIIIRESVKTKQKSTPIEADQEYTINVPQNDSPARWARNRTAILHLKQPAKECLFPTSPLQPNSPLFPPLLLPFSFAFFFLSQLLFYSLLSWSPSQLTPWPWSAAPAHVSCSQLEENRSPPLLATSPLHNRKNMLLQIPCQVLPFGCFLKSTIVIPYQSIRRQHVAP